jgi:hypothetical protein
VAVSAASLRADGYELMAVRNRPEHIDHGELPPIDHESTVSEPGGGEKPAQNKSTQVWAIALLLFVACGQSQPTDLPFELEEGETFLSEEPPIVNGAPAPEPEFDASTLGMEWPMEAVESMEISPYLVRPLVPDLKITLIGATPDGTEAAIVDSMDTCVWAKGTSEGLCTQLVGEDAVVAHGGFDGIVSWGPLPDNTSVVVLEYGDTSLWQRPVAGFAVFDTEMGQGDEFTLSAIDAAGDTIHTQDAASR